MPRKAFLHVKCSGGVPPSQTTPARLQREASHAGVETHQRHSGRLVLSARLPSPPCPRAVFLSVFPSQDLLRVALSSEAFLASVYSLFLLACKLVSVASLPQLDYNPLRGRLLFESQISPFSPAGSEVPGARKCAHGRKAPGRQIAQPSPLWLLSR